MSEGNFSSELLAQVQNGYNILKKLLYVVLALWFATILVFVLYIFNTDEYSVEATGIYTAVDHSGNIITQDVDQETWQLFMEWLELNGQSQGDR